MRRGEFEHFILKSGPLLLVLFIDGMGLGLVVPILNGLIFDPNAQFLENSINESLRNVVYGAVIGIFMLCWFFGAAILGDMSDQIGRKKALIICLAGAFLSYVASALAVIYHSLDLLIIGRVIAGFTSGSQPIAQAAIVDLSTPATKARNIGYILLALSMGFILGPLLGGILSDPTILPWFTFATPFYFAAFISFINMIILWLFFKDTIVLHSRTFKINPYQAIHIFISAFKNEQVKSLSIIFFTFIFGWSSFYSFIAMYLLKVYFFTPTEVSMYMAVMGVGFGVGNGFLVNYMSQILTLRKIFLSFTLLSAIIILIMIAFPLNLLNWLLIAPLGCCIATAYACILTLFSNQVDENSQGWVMGITGSIMAFVWALNGIVVGIIAAFHDKYPLSIASIFLFVTVAATHFLFPEPEDMI